MSAEATRTPVDQNQATEAPGKNSLRRPQIQQLTTMAPGPALPISVTTAAHAAPRNDARQDKGPTQVLDSSSTSSSSSVLSQRLKPLNHGVRPGGPLPSLNTSSSRRRPGITLPAGIAATGGGITLPSIIQPSGIQTKGISHKPPVRVIVSSNPRLKAMSLLSTKSAVKVKPLTGNNPVYSSACKASVAAHQNKLQRRVSSAPGELTPLSGSPSRTIQGAKYKYRKVVGGKQPIPRSMSLTFNNDLSPQVFLDNLIKSRGYSTRNFCSLEGGYYCKPTPLQKASYGIRLVQAVRQSDADTLKKILTCGISPNPCNAFGESVVHMVCRRGDFTLLKTLKEAGCSLQVTDDFGRTPLHDACWTAEPNFSTVEMILNDDERLLHIVDCRGSSPLSYVKRDHWPKWIAFFQSQVEKYWPHRDIAKDGEEPPPSLCCDAPHSKPVKDPDNAISLEVAQLIASGKMSADEYLSGGTTTSAPPPARIQAGQPVVPNPTPSAAHATAFVVS